MNRKIFSNVKILALIAVAVAIFSSSALMFQDNTQAEIIEYDGVNRAVIIDQLHYDIPNPGFQTAASQMLQDAGFQVDIFTTEDITVDFYKKLPSMNYNFIVIRSHSTNDKTDSNVALFTGEEYQENKYISEQLNGQVAKGAPLQRTVFHIDTKASSPEWSYINTSHREMISSFVRESQSDDEFFLVTPKLVNELMVGKFPGSTIVIGGCDSLSNPSFAKSLIERGASSVVGWDDTIDSFTNDSDMLKLLNATLVNNMELDEAVNFVMEDRDWNKSLYNARLSIFQN